MIDSLSDRFQALYNPHREVSVDEAMIPFKGRSTLKQYMPQKPVKRGIKVWMLADTTNGYVTSLEVYTGKKGNTTEVGLGGKVVISLTKHLQICESITYVPKNTNIECVHKCDLSLQVSPHLL